MENHQGRPAGAWSTERTGEDAMTLYLAEISRVPLLTAEQEITLASRIAAGTQAVAALAQANQSSQAVLSLLR